MPSLGPIVVTGASTGIGLAVAAEWIRAGGRVYAGVRKQQDADRLVAELGAELIPLRLDVTDREAIAAAAARVTEDVGDRGLVGLVNNAGIAVPGALLHMTDDELRWQFEVNLFGQVAVTRAFAPLLGVVERPTAPPGRIVNMSSVGGRMSGPFLGAYAGTKHALEALSDALRRELLPWGVDVVVVQPGAIKTPIWDKADELDVDPAVPQRLHEPMRRLQRHMVHEGRTGLDPAVVGRVVHRALTVRRPRTRYTIVPGRLLNWTLPRMLPDRVVDRMLGGRLGLLPGPR